MENAIKSLLLIIGSLAVIIAVTWVIVARPVLLTKGRYNPESSVKPNKLRSHVEVLSETLIPRDFSHHENLDRAADYIKTVFRTTGAEVYEQPFPVNGMEYKNVIAEYGPESNELIIVGAHYDVFGELPGADDNASAVAGLLELGHLLSTAEICSRVMLVAFSLEEPPFFATEFMGSAVHARSLKEKGANVKIMICLEMIGYFTNEKGSQSFPVPGLSLFYPGEGNFIAVVDQLISNCAYDVKKSMGEVIEIPVYSFNVLSILPGVDFSDHRSYWKQGYNAVMITDTAFYRNRAYHTKGDTADRLDYAKMAQVVYGVYHYVISLSNKMEK